MAKEVSTNQYALKGSKMRSKGFYVNNEYLYQNIIKGSLGYEILRIRGILSKKVQSHR